MAEDWRFRVTYEVIVRETGEQGVIQQIDMSGPKPRYLVMFPFPVSSSIPVTFHEPKPDQWFDRDELDPAH